MSRLALQSQRVLLDGAFRAAWIEAEDGVIARVGDPQSASPPDACEDLGDIVILPGLVDSHVHFNEPGRTEWEGFETGTLAGAAGGVTLMADMPLNSAPATITADAFAEKLRCARGQLYGDVVLHAGYCGGPVSDLEATLDAGAAAVKVFLIDSGVREFPCVDDEGLRKAAEVCARRGVPLLVHAELERRRRDESQEDTASDPKTYVWWLCQRSSALESNAIELCTEVAEATNCAIHIVHISSVRALETLQAGQNKGLRLSGETCPHYLWFSAESIPNGAPLFKCAPPIRESRHRNALWQALSDGTLSMVVSDHSPCPAAMRNLEKGSLAEAWGGIASLQLGLSVVWTAAVARNLQTKRVLDWMAKEPARLLGLDQMKGRIAPGFHADLVAFDETANWKPESEHLFQRHKETPYAGADLKGRVLHTWVRGEQVVRDGQPTGARPGRVFLRTADGYRPDVP